MNSIENRIIWVFREGRSGGTSAAEVIYRKLNRQYIFVDSSLYPSTFYKKQGHQIFVQKEQDHKLLFNTHYFPALHSMCNYDDPILIRISRKNVVEQCLSFLAGQSMNWKFTNLKANGETQNLEIFEEFIKSKILIKKSDVDFFARHRMKQNYLWNHYAPDYDNQVIYYEDMMTNIDIPLLNLYNVTLTSETLKLPDYKKEVFVNYEDVEKWLSVYPNL
jgi:hypothetical protein